jgi:hypothetical protein
MTKLSAVQPPLTLVDVTSRGPEPWVRFSPFFPHLNIPIPFTEGRTSASVEGVWQALKVFERADVNPDVLDNTSMRKLKRTTRAFGRCLGHREGLFGERLMSYLEARKLIYLPTYRWVLEHKLAGEVARLRALAQAGPVVMLDYEINCDVEDLTRPLSHAGLVVAYLEDRYPM